MPSTTVAFGTADAATTSYTYDLDGRKLTQTDPRGNTTTYTYDDAGRMLTTKDAIGNVTQFAYDAIRCNYSLSRLEALFRTFIQIQQAGVVRSAGADHLSRHGARNVLLFEREEGLKASSLRGIFGK